MTMDGRGQNLTGTRTKGPPPTAGRGWNAGLILECTGDDCRCKRGDHVHPPVLFVFDPEQGRYLRSEARCTARWGADGDGFLSGQICGRQVTHNVGDLWICEHHYKTLRWWMIDKGGRVVAALEREAVANRRHALDMHRQRMELDQERHQEQLRLNRELAAEQRELDRQRVLAEQVARAEASLVYYAQRSDGLIKIGTSREVAQRLATLKRDHGILTLLATHGGGHKQEHEMHVLFKALRSEGEWFRPEVPLLEHIAKIRKSGDELRAPGLPECLSIRAVNGMLYRARCAARTAAREAVA